MSPKTQERLLYLASPIGLLLLWQLLLMVGIGDRRFVPAPSDIALRYWQMLASGELIYHSAVTLYRVFAGFFIGIVPAIAAGLLMAKPAPNTISNAAKSPSTARAGTQTMLSMAGTSDTNQSDFRNVR